MGFLLYAGNILDLDQFGGVSGKLKLFICGSIFGQKIEQHPVNRKKKQDGYDDFER